MNRLWPALVLSGIIFLGGCGREPVDLPNEITTEVDGAEMVLVPKGEFLIGSLEGEGEERPEKKVWLPSFYIDKYAVTNAQYAEFLKYIDTYGDAQVRCPFAPEIVDYTPRYWDDDTLNASDHPVVGVDYYCAWAYARWAKKRLLTEFEWEKAARGTDGRKYPWGNEEPDADGNWRANYARESEGKQGDASDGYARTAPVKAFPEGASPYGAIQMAGNVYEWTDTFFDPTYYARMPYKDPKGPPNSEYRTVRGGSWKWRAFHIRCSKRRKLQHRDRKSDLGFRLAKDP
ncbi:MAG: formylglycine-generating enzyme family protein [Planctomycetota bacterium]